MYDLLIKNGQIIDGTGSPLYLADVAIENGKIVCIAKGLEGAKREIDATGLVVTPGFIDSHSHSDTAVLVHPDQTEKVEQGITTSIAGQCGESMAPNSQITMGTFLDTAKEVPQGANIAMFVGHNALRRAVMGMDKRAPSEEEMEKMKELLREALEHGAIGISFGLIYPPGCYADTEELVALAKVAGENHALVAAHIRDESHFVVRAAQEFIQVVRESGARGILSHHKSTIKENWGKVNHTLRMIDEANQEGVEVYCDVYPYTASSTSLAVVFISKEFHSPNGTDYRKLLSDPETRKKIKEKEIEKRGNDDLSWVQIIGCKGYPEYEGMRVSEIAKIHGKDAFETIYDMIEKSGDCSACYFTMCEEDVETVLRHPRAMVCTDSDVVINQTIYHPRLRGSFPRVLGRYVRERGVTTLQEMIRKMTSMPAAVYGLRGKGLIREGFDADICIFDPEKIIDHAGFVQCHARAEGLNYVILGGEVVVEDAVFNGKRMGKVILR